MGIRGFSVETGGDGIRKFDLHIQETDFGLRNLTSEFDSDMNIIGMKNEVITTFSSFFCFCNTVACLKCVFNVVFFRRENDF